MIYHNPIIPGFYPDPSICRVGKDYYLVTSSFQYFPGVPIFHSRDLVNWRQIGHCLTRPSQLPLKNAYSSGGIYAPTIRYHNGRFYMVTTNVSHGGNFYVYTEDPAGEWSEPIFVAQEGIDPSLFFDDDGRVYFCGTGGREGIALSEIDIETGKILQGPKHVWPGSGGRYPEAPHIYKINNKYYLMIAEGGTEYGHMVTIARSDHIWGPYEGYKGNPILTHRNLNSHIINGTGHGDLVQDENGNWWMVFLAFRNTYGYFHHLGRETYLAPVDWNEEGWPVVNGNGTVDIKMETDRIQAVQVPMEIKRDDFDSPGLNLYWNFIRNPYEGVWSLTERPGWLRLYGTPVTLDDQDSPAFIGRRQQHLDCTAETLLEFYPQKEGDEAGLTVYMHERYHYDIAVVGNGSERKVIVRKTVGDICVVTAEEAIGEGPVKLQVRADHRYYYFGYALEDGPIKVISQGENRFLSTEVAGGFTGVFFGMYAISKDPDSKTSADFDWFDYRF